MDGSAMEKAFATMLLAILGVGILIGVGLVGVVIGLWYLFGWLSQHLAWT